MMSPTDPAAPILALDTATDACTVALVLGERVAWRGGRMPREHASRLLGLVDEVMDELRVAPSDLAAVAWCHGPGSFTGLRIAAGAVQGIAWGAGVPVVGVSTLAVMAQGSHRRLGARYVLSALDARMGEVYWGVYGLDPATGLMQPRADDRVCPPEAVTAPAEWVDTCAVGTGWGAHADSLLQQVGSPTATDEEDLPDALDLLPFARQRLISGQAGSARDATPVYLRDRVTG